MWWMTRMHPYLSTNVLGMILPSAVQKMKWLALCALMALLQMACQSSNAKKMPDMKPVDTSITAQNAFMDVFTDSATVLAFVQRQKLNEQDSIYIISFYKQRNYQLAWYDSSGVAEQAYNFINLYRSYQSSTQDSSLLQPDFDALANQLYNDSLPQLLSQSEKVQADLLLTRHFFRYAERAYAADAQINLRELDWFIPKRKTDPVAFLDTVVASGGKDISKLLPVHPLFEGLRKALLQYTALAKAHAWAPIAFAKKKYELGDSAVDISSIKQRLIWLGDLAAADTGHVFTPALQKAILQFQQRMGLAADGVAGKGFLEAINVPLEERIKQIRINMERARWIPKPGNGKYVVVNIPEFMLRAFDSGQLQLQMNVVVGKPANNTVIFNGNMQYVVLAPYWNVPYSIVKNEMGRTAAYFSKRNMEVVGKYSDGLPMVRQKPGPNNSLGRVKFLFPNSYSIYLHDTPSKSLFEQNKRAFSHGCIRVAKPRDLALWALAGNKEWTAEKIDSGMSGNKEISITLQQKIPVFIGYFTCWTDANGLLHFRNDIYGHDKKLGDHLFAAAK